MGCSRSLTLDRQALQVDLVLTRFVDRGFNEILSYPQYRNTGPTGQSVFDLIGGHGSQRDVLWFSLFVSDAIAFVVGSFLWGGFGWGFLWGNIYILLYSCVRVCVNYTRELPCTTWQRLARFTYGRLHCVALRVSITIH